MSTINPLTHLIVTLNNSWKPLHIDLYVLIYNGNVSIHVRGVCNPITGIDIEGPSFSTMKDMNRFPSELHFLIPCPIPPNMITGVRALSGIEELTTLHDFCRVKKAIPLEQALSSFHGECVVFSEEDLDVFLREFINQKIKKLVIDLEGDKGSAIGLAYKFHTLGPLAEEKLVGPTKGDSWMNSITEFIQSAERHSCC